MANLEAKIKELVAEQLDVDASEVSMDSSFIDDLGADSLDFVELVMAFEESFDVEISDDEADTIKTVGDALNFIKSNLE